jgi:hypothetical protein
MVVFLMLKVVMARGKRLKKGGGDLEAQKQNVASSYSTTRKQNVDALQAGLGEQKMLLHHNQNLGNKMLFHQNRKLMNQAIYVA